MLKLLRIAYLDRRLTALCEKHRKLMERFEDTGHFPDRIHSVRRRIENCSLKLQALRGVLPAR